MNLKKLYAGAFSLSTALLVASCATPQWAVERDRLKADPAWPKLRAAAQGVIRDKEPDFMFSRALGDRDLGELFPTGRENGVWRIVANADYPANSYGEIVVLKLTDAGDLVEYKNLAKK